MSFILFLSFCFVVKIRVDKVVRLRPHLLLVSKTVSRLAQEWLLERGVTLVQNVKVSMINAAQAS